MTTGYPDDHSDRLHGLTIASHAGLSKSERLGRHSTIHRAGRDCHASEESCGGQGERPGHRDAQASGRHACRQARDAEATRGGRAGRSRDADHATSEEERQNPPSPVSVSFRCASDLPGWAQPSHWRGHQDRRNSKRRSNRRSDRVGPRCIIGVKSPMRRVYCLSHMPNPPGWRCGSERGDAILNSAPPQGPPIFSPMSFRNCWGNWPMVSRRCFSAFSSWNERSYGTVDTSRVRP